MKTTIAILTAAWLMGCGKSDNELRQLMREEIEHASAKSFITSGQTIGPYSPAVKVGNIVFVSGQIGIDQTTNLVGTDIESQTRQALTNLGHILAQAGCDSSDVVQCTVYLKDMKEFPRMNLIYGGYFSDGKYPARATVEVANLPKNAVVEIACIAVID
jgi:2-iminobutanoate/2-iminopropanoate deaminase